MDVESEPQGPDFAAALAALVARYYEQLIASGLPDDVAKELTVGFSAELNKRIMATATFALV